MPKEQTHWILARHAWSRLENGQAKRMISQNPNLYLLGAVIPDTPMYALERAEEYGELAHRLHGKSGENTFAPLARLVETCEGGWSGGMWAFVLGALSHILADAVFHPWVEYYTGSSTDVPDDVKLLSLARHRELESYLDLYFMRKSGRLKPRAFFSRLRAKEMDAGAFDDMVSLLYFQQKSTKKDGVRKALYAHGAIQWLFTQKALARLAYIVNQASGRKGDAWVSLFYPYAEPENPHYFHSGIYYRHPVTGRPWQGAVEDLTKKATRITARMFQLVEKRLDQGAVVDFFQRIKGPSLETGLVGVPTSAISYYDLETELDVALGVPRAVK